MKKDKKSKKKEAIKFIGLVYVITKRKLTTDHQLRLSAEIDRLRSLKSFRLGWVNTHSRVLDLVNQLNSMSKIVETKVVHNLLPTVGLTAIIDHLTNSSPSPSSLKVNYFALGDSATAPAAGDTTLTNETYRNAVASTAKANNVGYITGFFTATEVTGTIEEVGLFINGTASADTGTLLSHALLSVTKSATETLTVDYELTASSA